MHREPRELIDTTMILSASRDRRTPAQAPAEGRARTRVQHPAALLYGPAHVVVHGNPPFVAEFGGDAVGLPAAEALLDFPHVAFELMDRVYDEARPLARWVTVRGSRRRLTVIEKRDAGTGEVYGIALHLVPAAARMSDTHPEEGNR